MITGNIIGGIIKNPDTIILIDEEGNEHPAVPLDEEVELTATTNDVRLGKTVALEKGVETGEKFIPSYHTKAGYRKISAGSAMKVPIYDDTCQYTKMQAIVCAYNTTTSDSVAAVMVSIDSKVYETNSDVPLGTVEVDAEEKLIDLAIINTFSTPVLIRYILYKEI